MIAEFIFTNLVFFSILFAAFTVHKNGSKEGYAELLNNLIAMAKDLSNKAMEQVNKMQEKPEQQKTQ